MPSLEDSPDECDIPGNATCSRIKKAQEEEEMRKLTKPKPDLKDVNCILTSLAEILSAENRSKRRRVEIDAAISNDLEVKVEVIKELESYDDCNFLCRIGTEKYLLKIHNGVESQAYIEENENRDSFSSISLQNQMMNHLSKAKYGITSSRPVLDVILCDLPVLSAAHSPRKLAVRLLKWIEGQPMSSCSSLPIERVLEAGVLLGRVNTALDEFMDEIRSSDDASLILSDRSALMRIHSWDVKNTDQVVSNFTKYIRDNDMRLLVEDVLQNFTECVIPISEKLATGIIHNDFNDANILVDSSSVCGIIDYGDSVCSWKVNEIAIAMAYAMLSTFGKTKHSLASAAAMLRGFSSEYKLSPLEKSLLRILIAARLACSFTLGSYSYSLNPENEYLLLHAEPAKNALKLIWGGGCDKEDIDNLFDVACAKIVKDENGNICCSDISMPDPDVIDQLKSSRINASMRP